MTTCGLCGQSTRYIGSHVINSHCPYAAGQDAITDQLRAELIARAKRDKAPLPYQAPDAYLDEAIDWARANGLPYRDPREPYRSPSTRRALAGELPGKVLR